MVQKQGNWVINSSQETSNIGFVHANNCSKGRNQKGFQEGDPLRQLKAQKIMGYVHPYINFNRKTEYSWQEANAMHLVGLARNDLL